MKGYFAVLLVITSIQAFNSCSRENELTNVTSLTYKLDLEITSDTIDPLTAEYLLQKFGDSLIMSINKEGSIRFDYYGSGEQGYDFNLFNVRTNHFYAKWKNLDTLYHYDANSNILKLVEMNHLNNQSINSINCKVLQIKGVDKEYPNYYVNQTFYYNSDTLQINPKKYKRYKEFFFYNYLLKSNSLYLKKVLEMPEYRLTYTLINTDKNKSMDIDRFNPPNNITMKEF